MPQIRDGGRRSIRLPEHDYGLPGECFFTICTQGRAPTLLDARVRGIVQAAWNELPRRFPGVMIDEFVIMPNHIHGIIVFADDLGAISGAPTLGRVVQWFKARVTRRAREAGCLDFTWLRNYYEHIVRTPEALETIRQYIRDSPERWQQDRENPGGTPDMREKAFWRRFRHRGPGGQAGRPS